MRGIRVAVGAMAIAAVVVAVGCGSGQPEPDSSSTAPASGLDITLRTTPDPVRMGDNTLEVTVREDGQPVTDASVSAEFYMAAMPSMNMPEMRSKADLSHAGNGMYRGQGQVSMAGNWDVTITVMRGGQQIGSRKIAVTAK